MLLTQAEKNFWKCFLIPAGAGGSEWDLWCTFSVPKCFLKLYLLKMRCEFGQPTFQISTTYFRYISRSTMVSSTLNFDENVVFSIIIPWQNKLALLVLTEWQVIHRQRIMVACLYLTLLVCTLKNICINNKASDVEFLQLRENSSCRSFTQRKSASGRWVLNVFISDVLF